MMPPFGGILLYLAGFFIPRLFLLGLLIIDIFYYNCIHLFYEYAYVGLIPLVVKYYMYVIRTLKEEYMVYLDKWYYVEEMRCITYEGYTPRCTNEIMTIKQFVELKSYCYTGVDDEILDMKKCVCCFQLALFNKHNKLSAWGITEEEYALWKKDFYDLIPPVIDIARFLDYNDNVVEKYADKMSKYRAKRLYIIWTAVLVCSGFLICWAYVLLVSLPTFYLLPIEMELMSNFQDNCDPFSGTTLQVTYLCFLCSRKS
jgi:hypothetical protein